MISAISFVPVSVTDDWPELAQRALAIATEVRDLVVDVAADLATSGGDVLRDGGALVLEEGGHLLEDGLSGLTLPDLGDWLPDTDGGLQPPPTRSPDERPRVAGSFSTAKRYLYEKVNRGHRVTFYCGCTYNGQREVDLGSCGLEGYRDSSRARRVEAEHVFPASQFGNYRKCWREPEDFADCRQSDGDVVSGRDCCERVDPVFEAAHNDLHNLVPAVGLINGERSNYTWGMVPRSSSERYGPCEIRIDSEIRRVQPPDSVRGDIARIMFYMRDTYGFRLSSQSQQLFAAWNRQDPPDAWERKRNRRIERLQGIGNRHVSDYAAASEGAGGRSGTAM